MIFEDRPQAGTELAGHLKHLREKSPIVLALPRGGVVVAYPVARALEAPLEVIIARKLGAPGHEEFGFGAIGPGGVRVINESAARYLGLTPADIDRVARRELAEMNRRTQKYQQQRRPVDLAGRTVVLVDDGLATGVTARAAIVAIRQKQPEKIVLAVPVAPAETVQELSPEVDELVCLATPPNFQAIGQWYARFDQVSDDEVLDLLERAHYEHSAALAHRS